MPLAGQLREFTKVWAALGNQPEKVTSGADGTISLNLKADVRGGSGVSQSVTRSHGQGPPGSSWGCRVRGAATGGAGE